MVALGILGKLNEILLGYVLQIPTSLSSSSILKSIYDFLVNANPFILIILGVVIFFAGKLAKFVGIIIIILGLIHLVLPYLLKTL